MNAAVLRRADPGLPAHPNELDRKRIERSLKSRQRYRYVSPTVTGVVGGYVIESPCCSRNIDAEGGVIDVALLHYDPTAGTWQHPRLVAVTDLLNADPDRVFWQ